MQFGGEDLVDILRDSSRPTFLFGSTPPREGTSPEKARESCRKFVARSAVLATDGYIVYDIQDEKGRTHLERPFPFRKTLDPSWYATIMNDLSGKRSVVYKSVVEAELGVFDKWVENANDTHGHNTFVFVGAPSSKCEYKGPTLVEAMQHVRDSKTHSNCAFGSVCIPERHIKKGNEHLNMLRKTENGAEWFITQGIYDSGPLVGLLQQYGDACRARSITPKKVMMTFAPCGRPKTMTFIKWLGMNIPATVEERILGSADPVQESINICSEVLTSILEGAASSGVPLGINVESLSIFKEEIDGAHRLFGVLQAKLLNARGSPWAVRWICIPTMRIRLSRSNLQASATALGSIAETSHTAKDKAQTGEEGATSGPSAQLSASVSASAVTAASVAVLLGFVAGRLSASR